MDNMIDILFDLEDLLESGESLQDYFEEVNDYLDGTMCNKEIIYE